MVVVAATVAIILIVIMIFTKDKNENNTLSTANNNNDYQNSSSFDTPYFIPSTLQILSNDDDSAPTEQYEAQISLFLQTSDTWPSGRTTSSRRRQQQSPQPRVLHVIKTRLMQEQASLHHLNRARLLLFRTFSLPTMASQTQQNFIWMIKVDPLLHGTAILHELIQYVQEYMIYNNTYIIGSNNNYRIQNEKVTGSIRDGSEVFDLLNCRIYTGDPVRFQLALSLYEAPLPLLETRLDADDGLHTDLIATMQHTALDHFQKHAHVQWMYFCCRRHMEWHWIDPLTTTTITADPNTTRSHDPSSSYVAHLVHRYGVLQGVTHTHLCITPGITTAYNSHTREHTVPVFAHDEIVKKLRGDPKNPDHDTTTTGVDCGYGEGNSSLCLQFIETFLFEAIRSRTPTSAGMLQIQPKQIYDTVYIHYMFWNVLYSSFLGVTRANMKFIQDYFNTHIIEICRDNLIGQCTTGHSCKESAKLELQQLIQSRQQLQQH